MEEGITYLLINGTFLLKLLKLWKILENYFVEDPLKIPKLWIFFLVVML